MTRYHNEAICDVCGAEINGSPGAHTCTIALVKRLREETECGIMVAKQALEKREGNYEFAKEYINNIGLAAVMSFKARYPKWAAHLATRENKDRSLQKREMETYESVITLANHSSPEEAIEYLRMVVEQNSPDTAQLEIDKKKLVMSVFHALDVHRLLREGKSVPMDFWRKEMLDILEEVGVSCPKCGNGVGECRERCPGP